MSTIADFVLDRDSLAAVERGLRVPDAVAVVGAGRWGKILCNVLTAFAPPISCIVLVAERNHAATEQWLEDRKRETPGNGHDRVVISPSLAPILESDRIEAAFVTKMASEHYAAARQLLLAGKHVLVEKPFVLTSREAEELVAIARRTGRTLAVGYEFMFVPALHRFRQTIAAQLTDVSDVQITWHDDRNVVKWGVLKQPDLSANIVTDIYPHVLSQLFVLFGHQAVELRQLTSRDGSGHARLVLRYGAIAVTAELDKHAPSPRRCIEVRCAAGRSVRFDFTTEPGQIDVDGRIVSLDGHADGVPSSLTSQVAYFFARTRNADVMIPNTAEQTVHFVEATEQAASELRARQTQELRSWLWREMPGSAPDTALRILRHQMLDGLLRHGLLENPKDTEALDVWAHRVFRIAHRFSREPWTTQAEILEQERLDRGQLVALNAAMRESDFLQNLVVREGVARQYWSSILPLVETGSVQAVVNNSYMFPLRLGIYAAVSCMFSCTFCGRMENPSARYQMADVAPGNDLFDQVFSAMPKGISTLSLGGGLEPLTNPRLDDVIRSAKRHGHKVPLVTNGYMLTPLYVKRHEGLWDADILRISLYGVDEPSYRDVTKKPGAHQLVKANVIEFLKERRRRGAGPRVGFNFIVLVNTTDEVLRILDLIADINAAVGGKGIDFLTLREDFSLREGEGLSVEERQRLVAIFQEFKEKRDRVCPDLSVDYGYALYPLSQGAMWKGLAMVGHDRMLPKAYPQVSVALDLLGDVYLYRDAAFPNRPGANRYIIGRIAKDRPLEMVVRDFLEKGADIPPLPNDTWLMDAFDHVVTNLVWQAKADEATGIPFRLGPIARRATDRERDAARAKPAAVNYWQGLFGA